MGWGADVKTTMVSVVHICSDCKYLCFSPFLFIYTARSAFTVTSVISQICHWQKKSTLCTSYLLFLCNRDNLTAACLYQLLQSPTLSVCRYQSTKADRRKWWSINTQVSWKPASFLSCTELLGRLVHSSAPSEGNRSRMMTLLLRAGLSTSKTLHHFGERQKQFAPKGSGTVAVEYTCTTAVLCLQPHMKQQHTSKVRSAGVQWDVGHG